MSQASEYLRNLFSVPIPSKNIPLQKNQGVLFFGAGQVGSKLVKGIESAGYKIIGFIDDSPQKQELGHEGYEVWSCDRAVDVHGPAIPVVVSIYKNEHQFFDSKSRLNELGFQEVYSFFDCLKWFEEELTPFYCFGKAKDIDAYQNEIINLNENFIDSQSRKYLSQIIELRRLGNQEALSGERDSDFIFNDYIKKKKEWVYIDGGSYDGDTIDEFLDRNINFKAILGFEPDPKNFAKLSTFVGSLSDGLQEKIKVFEMALSDHKGKLNFSDGLGECSKVDTVGGIEVNCDQLDNIVPEGENIFIKLDLEGGEREALLGAKTIIEKHSPLIGISVYHKPKDLWELPAIVKSINPNYKFALRFLNEELIDTMVYCIPT